MYIRQRFNGSLGAPYSRQVPFFSMNAKNWKRCRLAPNSYLEVLLLLGAKAIGGALNFGEIGIGSCSIEKVSS